LALFLVAQENTYKWYVSNYFIPYDHATIPYLGLRADALKSEEGIEKYFLVLLPGVYR
jgi:hypothetical protein